MTSLWTATELSKLLGDLGRRSGSPYVVAPMAMSAASACSHGLRRTRGRLSLQARALGPRESRRSFREGGSWRVSLARRTATPRRRPRRACGSRARARRPSGHQLRPRARLRPCCAACWGLGLRQLHQGQPRHQLPHAGWRRRSNSPTKPNTLGSWFRSWGTLLRLFAPDSDIRANTCHY